MVGTAYISNTLPPCSDDTEGCPTASLISTTSTLSMASDGIPIVDKSSEGEDGGEPQYEWNKEGEREIPEERGEKE